MAFGCCSMCGTKFIRKESKISHSYGFWLLCITVVNLILYISEAKSRAESCKQSSLYFVVLLIKFAFLMLKSKGNRNFLPKSSFRLKFLLLLKETETNFCLFGFGLAETESFFQSSVVNQNFGRNLASSEP